MDRSPQTWPIERLRSEFAGIEFPEYQREPSVWSKDQKQRLIDSILRSFDIAAIYFYVPPGGDLECIDGRQRLNAIMSFLGENPDDADNGFTLKIENEVGGDGDGEDPLADLNGLTYADLEQLEPPRNGDVLAYELIVVFLEGSRDAWEFNLQFLRLNLGTLINAGEKLHAMVGAMRDLLFESDRLGQHPFLADVGVPTRRYARELIVAQLMLQVSTLADKKEFARARHFDLQRYLKEHSDAADPHAAEVSETLDALQASAPDLSERLRNRAICVSVLLAAWHLRVQEHRDLAADRYGDFVELFLQRLSEEVARMKEFTPDPRYEYLREFQRHLTQAAVERPAVKYRHDTLVDQFHTWIETGKLRGDD